MYTSHTKSFGLRSLVVALTCIFLRCDVSGANSLPEKYEGVSGCHLKWVERGVELQAGKAAGAAEDLKAGTEFNFNSDSYSFERRTIAFEQREVRCRAIQLHH